MSHKYLCLMWSYLGGVIHFAFTWSVVPVVVIYVGAALFCSHCLWWVVCGKVSILPNCTLGGGVLYPCYDEFWGGGTCGGFPWCIVNYFACVMVNSMFSTLLRWWTILFLSFFFFWFYSLDDSGQFLCVVSLKCLWVPVNLFLLHD